MSEAIDNLRSAIQTAIANRPAVEGFPFLAETLRRAGVTRNIWQLPACQSLYITASGPVVICGQPLSAGFCDVPPFDEAALIHALRTDQAGNSSFEEFLSSCWAAGIVSYEVDFDARTVDYRGAAGEVYSEAYPHVSTETA